MVRKIYEEFVSANTIGVTVEHNGLQGGDADHGGFVKIIIKDLDCTSMFLNGKQCENFEVTFKGTTERQTLLSALKMIVNELEDNAFINHKIEDVKDMTTKDINAEIALLEVLRVHNVDNHNMGKRYTILSKELTIRQELYVDMGSTFFSEHRVQQVLKQIKDEKGN